jgi:two-component system, chemotaxis family, chemotaxis protein CheY
LILSCILEPFGKVHRAQDGEAGLDAFCEALQRGEPFDLVCLDIMMPNMDGQTALKRIRSFESEHRVPSSQAVKVIMTTALGDKDNVVEALPRCDAYLQKPINATELLFYIKKLGLMSAADAARVAARDRKRAEDDAHRGNATDVPWVD